MDKLSDIIARVKSYEPLWDGWICTGEILGSGGTGCVLALQRGEERSVVKVICVENEPDQYRMVKNEIDTMLSMHSDYLVECLHSREEPVLNRQGDCIGYDFLIHMHEYLPLSDFLKEEEYDPVALCRQLASDIGMALGALHAKGILHRDIKPENIFLDESKEKTLFRLGDFGVSKKLGGLSGLTATGTPDFMAPESFRYYEYSYSSDIYSLGMTLYYILNDLHFPQFSDGQSQQDLWDNNKRRLSGEKLPSPRFGDQDLQRVVLQCCEAEPKQRYRDVSEVLNELFGQHFVPFGMQQKADRSELRKKEIKGKWIRLALIVLAVFVVVTAIMGFIAGLNQPSTESEVSETATLGTDVSESVFSQYNSEELKSRVVRDSITAEVLRQQVNSQSYSSGNSNGTTNVVHYTQESGYSYIKQYYKGEDVDQSTNYAEYCFDRTGELFYICRVKENSAVQLYAINDEIYHMTATGDPKQYTYGDPEITDEMKAEVEKGYGLYLNYIENRQR